MRQYTYYIWDERPEMEICSNTIEIALDEAGLKFELAEVQVYD